MTKRVTFLLLLAAVSHDARAQTTQTPAPARFTAQHTIRFAAGTVQDRKVWSASPSARGIVADAFEIAREDLNDDGSKEVILRAASSDGCGSGGCAVVVLENRSGKATPILEQSLFAPLAVTNEKIGQYRALVTVDDKGVIVSGDRRGTPMFGKQMVYAMKVTETAQAGPPPAPRVSAPAPGVCAGQPNCAEAPTFAATVSDFRLSNDGTERVITATVRFVNKANRALVVGYVQNSGVVMDDQGNRYGVPRSDGVRGIGEIVGDRLDPKFSLGPGERGDARFEFTFQPARNLILGTTYEIDLTVREIDPVAGNQWGLGREYALHFRGFTDAGIVATAPVESARPAAVPTALTTALTTAPPTTPAADPCGARARCYSAGPFTAEVTRVVTSLDARSFLNNYAVRVTMKLTNVANQPVILGYVGGSGAMLDNLGNRYPNNDRSNPGAVSGIGIVRDGDADPQFALGVGESRNVIFESRRSAGKDGVPGSYSYDLTLAQLEILPSKQVRVSREYAVGFRNLTAAAGAASAPSSGPCGATPRCDSAGPVKAEVTRVVTSRGTTSLNNFAVRLTLKLTNLTERPLILGYVVKNGALIDDLGNEYQGDESAVAGIGVVGDGRADTRFTLAPGESKSASVELRRTVARGAAAPRAYGYDLTLAQLEILPSTQVRVAAEYTVGFTNLTASALEGAKEGFLDALKKALPKK